MDKRKITASCLLKVNRCAVRVQRSPPRFTAGLKWRAASSSTGSGATAIAAIPFLWTGPLWPRFRPIFPAPRRSLCQCLWHLFAIVKEHWQISAGSRRLNSLIGADAAHILLKKKKGLCAENT